MNIAAVVVVVVVVAVVVVLFKNVQPVPVGNKAQCPRRRMGA